MAKQLPVLSRPFLTTGAAAQFANVTRMCVIQWCEKNPHLVMQVTQFGRLLDPIAFAEFVRTRKPHPNRGPRPNPPRPR